MSHNRKTTAAAPTPVLENGPVFEPSSLNTRPAGIDTSQPRFAPTDADFVSPAGITQPKYAKGWLFVADYNKANFAYTSLDYAFSELNAKVADDMLNNPNMAFVPASVQTVYPMTTGKVGLGNGVIQSYVKAGVNYGVKVVPTRFSGSEADAVKWINSLTDKDNPQQGGGGFSPYG